MLNGEIFRQRLKIANAHVVADTIDYLEANFSFLSNDWDGLEKWAHFANGSAVYDIRLTGDRIRKEDHLCLTAGMWKVYLHGNKFRDGKVIQRITTDEAVLYVLPTGTLDGEPFPTVPPSAGEQIIASAEAAEAGAKSAANAAGRAAESAKESANLAKKSAEIVGDAEQIVQDALRDAKESGEFDGDDGITPQIGANGHWFVGETDTGVSAGGSGGDVFIAQYGVTTFAEIVEAVKAEKTPLLIDDGYYANLVVYEEDWLQFSYARFKVNCVYTLDPDDTWRKRETRLALEENGVPEVDYNGNDEGKVLTVEGRKTIWKEMPKELPNPFSLRISGGPFHAPVIYDGSSPVVVQLATSTDAPSPGGSTNADWGENDPEAAGYVRNRTHWAEHIEQYNTVLGPATFTRGEDGMCSGLILGFYDGIDYIIVNGDRCLVTINGTVYDCICFNDTLSADNATADENTEWYYKSNGRFGQIYVKNPEVTTVDVTVVKDKSYTVYHQIPKEFIPVPDISYNDLLDRPFYEDKTYLAQNVICNYIAVSGIYPEDMALPAVGDTAVVVLNGVEDVFLCTAASGNSIKFQSATASYTFAIYEDALSAAMGYYAVQWQVHGITMGDTVTVYLQKLKKIDKKFLPDTAEESVSVVKDWNQNIPEAAEYIKNRTHYIYYITGDECSKIYAENGTATEFVYHYSSLVSQGTAPHLPPHPMVSVDGKPPVLAIEVSESGAEFAEVTYKKTFETVYTGTYEEVIEWTFYLKSPASAAVVYEGVAAYHPLAVDFLPVEELRNKLLFKPAEYIEGDGASYIDTEFVPGSNTRVVCRALFANNGVTEYLFGARASSSAQRFSLYIGSAKYNSGFYGGTKTFAADVMYTEPITIDKNRGVITLAGEESIDHAVTTAFECPCTMTVFAVNTKGAKSAYSTAKIYNMQIYDDDVMVRDFVPCFNCVLGEYGLFDRLNDKFYRNRGTGIFGGELS